MSGASGPIAILVRTTIAVAEYLETRSGIHGDIYLADLERRYVADIADRLGANVTASVRASVRDTLCTAGV